MRIKFEIPMLLVALMMVWIPAAVAFPSQIMACNTPSCHVYPPTSINVTTDVTTKTVDPGEIFTVNVTWNGGSSSAQTEAKWPTDFSGLTGVIRNNSQFTPTPISSVAGVNIGGSLLSTLTAPNTPGMTHMLRVYASTGTGGNIPNHEADYKDITIMVRTPVTATFSISGFKVYSNNSTGVSGWPITLTNATINKTVTTETDGSYIFSGLENGTYNVTEENRTGWTPVGPSSLSVTINGNNATGKNFTNTPPTSPTPPPIQPPTVQTFSISGFKINGDNNTGISDWPITISNATMTQSTNTGTDGMYNFSNLVNDTYNVTEGNITGWTPVGPSTLSVTINGKDEANNNFTNTPSTTTPSTTETTEEGSISGYKLDAATGKGIPERVIILVGNNIKKKTSTDENGFYKFDNLPAGRYKVREAHLKGFRPVSSPSIHINLEAGQQSVDNNFKNMPKNEKDRHKDGELRTRRQQE